MSFRLVLHYSGQLKAIRREKVYLFRKLLAIGHESLDLTRDPEFIEGQEKGVIA